MSLPTHTNPYILVCGWLLSFCLLGLQSPAAFADEIQDRFDEAVAALDANEVYKAQRLLKELLTDYPTLHRARLELARANYYVRDYDAAEAEVLRVLDDPEVPASVRPTLLAFLAQIRDDKQGFGKTHNFGAYVYSGVMYDSNVNFGTNDVIIGGQPFLIDSERSDWAGVLDAGVAHTYNPNTTFRSGENTGYFLWQSQATGYFRGYVDEDDFNLGVATARTGPVWAVADAWRFSLAGQADQIWLGSDRLAFFATLNPTLDIILSPSTELTIDTYITDRNYNNDEDEGRDGTLISGTVILSRYFLEKDLGVQAGVGYSSFDADADAFGYDLPEVFVGATYKAWQGGTIYSRLGYRQYDFDENFEVLVDLGFPADREDDEWRVLAGFLHEIDNDFLRGWVVKGEYIYTDNDSDVDVFDYDRSQVSLGISRDF